MTSKVIDALRYGFSDSDRILIDANVWLYLFGPKPPNSAPARTYSAVFKGLQGAKTLILLDVLVLSEFVNRFARDEYQVQVRSGAMVSHDFKTFRDSADFVPIAQAIARSVALIGKFAQPIDHPLTAFDLPALISEFEKGSRDLNDQLLAETCKQNRLMLLSNDGDLSHAGITILTTNPRLLRRL